MQLNQHSTKQIFSMSFSAQQVLFGMLLLFSILTTCSCSQGGSRNNSSQNTNIVLPEFIDDISIYPSLLEPELKVKGRGFKNRLTSRREGEFTFTYQTEGNLVARKCTYRNGRLIGEMTDYYPSGELASIRFFDDSNNYTTNLITKVDILEAEGGDGPDFSYIANYEGLDTIQIPVNVGEWKFLYEYGAIQSILHYKNGELDGTATRYYGMDNIESEENYRDGVLHGSSKYYDFDGALIGSYNYVDGSMEGEQIALHSNGSLYWREVIQNDITQTSEGPFTESGRPILKVDSLNGKRHGQFVSYYPNDTIHIIAQYANGELDGTFRENFENGNPWFKRQYENGKLDGWSTVFSQDGHKLSEVPYKNGVANGMAWIYSENPPHDFVCNEVYVNGHLKESPQTPSYASDGQKCYHCGKGSYRGGFCSICGAASGERLLESFSNRANCEMCGGTGVVPNSRNKYRPCPSCRGKGIQTY